MPYSGALPESRSRQFLPDELRAIALLGIVLVNAPFIAVGLDGFTAEDLGGPLDRATSFLTTALAEGKFYLLFSFLFGYSANFIVRQGEAGDRRRWKRRLVALAVIGLVHAIFFFIGDILLAYAVLGAGLIPLFARSDKAVLVTGGVVAGLGLAWLGLLVLVAASDPGLTAQGGEIVDSYDEAMATGSFLDAAQARLETLPVALVELASIQWPLAFASFCVGLVAGRRRILADPAGKAALFRRMALIGLGVGLPAQFAAAALWFGTNGPDGSARSFAGLALLLVSAPVLSTGYLGALAILSASRPRLLVVLRPAGRASLSIYIGESIVLSTIFCAWGLGLFGKLGAFAVTVVALATWATLVVLVTLWLGRYPQGPLESMVSRWTGRGAPRQAEADKRKEALRSEGLNR